MAGKHHRRNRKNKYVFSTLCVLTVGTIMLHSCQDIGNTEIDQTEESGESLPLASESSSNTATTEEVPSLSEEEKLRNQIVPTPDVELSDWELFLVNRENQLTENPTFETYQAENGIPIDGRMSEAFERMLADGRALGLEFILVSGYRSIEHQQMNYDSVYSTYVNQGFSHEEAIEKTEDYIALPNASEHSTGLAVDITEPDLYYQKESGLVEEFESTAEGQWLNENAANYGFILRYPKGKEALTFIEYEPWHFRYVGVESALYIKEHDLSLEEYIAILEKNADILEQIESGTE